jgi:hypothetical protein
MKKTKIVKPLIWCGCGREIISCDEPIIILKQSTYDKLINKSKKIKNK